MPKMYVTELPPSRNRNVGTCIRLFLSLASEQRLNGVFMALSYTDDEAGKTWKTLGNTFFDFYYVFASEVFEASHMCSTLRFHAL